jgi:hypothetical protein
MKFSAWILLACFALSGFLPIFAKGAIDLVALKKQEEERRKKISKSKQAINDTNVHVITSGGKSYGFVQMESEGPPAEEKKSVVPNNENKENKTDETKQPEFWKKQQVELETRIAQLKETLDSDQLQLNKLWSDFYIKNIPAEQDAIRVEISQLTGQIEQNKLSLSQSETALEDLSERARKAGIPPGWLR